MYVQILQLARKSAGVYVHRRGIKCAVKPPPGTCHSLAIEIYGYRYIAADWTGFLSCLYDSIPTAIANFYNAKV